MEKSSPSIYRDVHDLVHRQTYQSYDQSGQKLGIFLENKVFLRIKKSKVLYDQFFNTNKWL